MARLAEEKKKVYENVKKTGRAEYKGIPIRIDVSEWNDGARFVAVVKGTNIYKEDLKKLMADIDRRLAGQRVRLDLNVLDQNGGEWTITTVSPDEAVNLSDGKRGREKVEPYYIPRRIFRDTPENRTKFDRLKEIRKEKYLLDKEERELRNSLDNYTQEEIIALVEEKAGGKKKEAPSITRTT